MKPSEILNQWIQAVNQADVDKLLSLYDQNAVLIPTFSNKILNTPEKIRDYFEKLGSREDLSIALHEKTLNEKKITEVIHVLNGIYNWRFKVGEEILNFEARFTYIMDISKPGPIVHHHSSLVPRMI